MLKFLLADYIDILMISESKLNSTFASWQFLIFGFRTLMNWIKTIYVFYKKTIPLLEPQLS